MKTLRLREGGDWPAALSWLSAVSFGTNRAGPSCPRPLLHQSEGGPLVTIPSAPSFLDAERTEQGWVSVAPGGLFDVDRLGVQWRGRGSGHSVVQSSEAKTDLGSNFGSAQGFALIPMWPQGSL